MNNWDIKALLGGGHVEGIFHNVISLENLFLSWREFQKGKGKKFEIQEFRFNLENNIFNLHTLLTNKKWQPNRYQAFFVRDPKLRHIHKATVSDRLIHQALFRILYQIFDRHFIFDSYSCRVGKGTHKGVLRLDSFIRKSSSNYTETTFALKCDIRKFFDNISHEKLLSMIKDKVKDEDTLDLIRVIIESFETKKGTGLPLGNVTSQLFANVFLDEFDQYIKHTLKIKYYVRYCDDFIILEQNVEKLRRYIEEITEFLKEYLSLELHPNKITIRKISQGIDFLGYVVFPHYVLLRTKTRKRIIRKIKYAIELRKNRLITKEKLDITIQSYIGMLTHCRGDKIKTQILTLLQD